MVLDVKPENSVELEKCVSCGSITDVPVDMPVEARSHYVEGVGQSCRKCDIEIYGSPALERHDRVNTTLFFKNAGFII